MGTIGEKGVVHGSLATRGGGVGLRLGVEGVSFATPTPRPSKMAGYVTPVRVVKAELQWLVTMGLMKASCVDSVD